MGEGMPQMATDFDDLYNAAEELIGRNLAEGRGGKTAFIDVNGSYTFDDVERLTNQFADAITERGVKPEQRIMLCMLDTIDFVSAFLGAIKAGVIPVPVNTRLTASDYSYMLDDSRAVALVLSDVLLPQFSGHLTQHPALEHVIVSGAAADGTVAFADFIRDAAPTFTVAPTRRDDMCFWLYTSGTTGTPKGAVHLQTHMMATAELYGFPVLGITSDDVVFSAAKLFFAYGLGNALTMPMAAGATAILHAGPPDAAAVIDILKRHKPSIFYGVPTLFGMLLASGAVPAPGEHGLRICTSAGEPLPAHLLHRWKEATGVDIMDGIGTTEMLHIFLSNRANDIQPGTTGTPVAGYDLRLVGDDGQPVPDGEMGTLEVRGPTSAVMYWNQRQKSRDTFRGAWTRTGDKYSVNSQGYFVYAGRNDDMMKVGGIYVSPFEVEAALVRHEAVLEAAVVGAEDQDKLVKPKAFVVLSAGCTADDALKGDLIAFAAKELAAFKRPRWIEFVTDLPKTATGKIQRFKLRDAD